METLTVACVYWKGNFRAEKYNPTPYSKKWVKRLARMVKRHLDVEHEFVCLTNDPFTSDHIRCIALEHEWQGWWAKMELFRPDLPVDGRILYFDLDMIIVDNIEPLIASRYPMVICSAFGKQKKLNPRGYNSSVMSFDRSDLTKDIWKTFYRAPRIHIRKLRSDQDFIIKYFPYIHKYPDEWIRKLGECERNGRLVFPEGMKILLSMPLKNHMAVDTYPELRELWG